MASSGSRIPKPPTTSGFKRPNENALSGPGKKPKFDLAPKSATTNATPRNYSVASVNGFGGFSENAKKAVLQPRPNLFNIRESMPVLRNKVNKPPVTSASTAKKPKRPAWDVKGRLQDIEECFSVEKQRNTDLNTRILALELKNQELNHDKELIGVKSKEASSSLEKLEIALREKTKEMDFQVKERDTQLAELKIQKETLHREVERLSVENATYQTELASLRSTVRNLTGSQAGLQVQLDAIKLLLCQAQEESDSRRISNEKYKKENEILENKIREEETTRRRLHNMVLELKGNIRVFCRIRPSLPQELTDGLQMSCLHPSEDNKTIEIVRMSDGNTAESIGKSRPKCEFSFDHVFKPTATQDNVFSEISQLVQSALDGYNVCIFAYGQTGSGKTYTMEGPNNLTDFAFDAEDSRLGMIPRSVEQIFSTAAHLESKSWKYRMEASFLEIYNEHIKDLLVEHGGPSGKCEIKKSGSKGTEGYVSNVTTIAVTSAKQVYGLLRKARVNRSVAATNCNERSSRSHYIFQIKLFGMNEITTEKCEGILNLVDLAGSERVKESLSAGDRLTEAKNINKSLSNLGNVIMALSQKADHIPYRNSKLTHLLMNSLGGNSKTLMFVNVSPNDEHVNETVNSLRFAAKVNQCNIGTAQRRVK